MKTKIAALAKTLGEMNAWVRLHYVYPYPHVDEVIPLMAEGKLLLYLDVPFQHASTRILKLMKWPANAENMLARIHAWRAICPDIHQSYRRCGRGKYRDRALGRRRSGNRWRRAHRRRRQAFARRLRHRSGNGRGCARLNCDTRALIMAIVLAQRTGFSREPRNHCLRLVVGGQERLRDCRIYVDQFAAGGRRVASCARFGQCHACEQFRLTYSAPDTVDDWHRDRVR